MYHPSYVAHTAESHRNKALNEAQTRRMVRAARKTSKRRYTLSPVAWRQPLATKQAQR